MFTNSMILLGIQENVEKRLARLFRVGKGAGRVGELALKS